MKVQEIINIFEFFDPSEGISELLADYFIGLKSAGIPEIATMMTVREIQKRYGQELSIEDLTRMFSSGQLPMVSDVTTDKITIKPKDSEIKNKEVDNSKDKVKDMAHVASARSSGKN